MSNVKQAPLMFVRRMQDKESIQSSFQTTARIPATLAAFREWMQKVNKGIPFTEQELMSVRFCHRAIHAQREDARVVDNGWCAAWQVKYLRDKDRFLAEQTVKDLNKRRRYHYTVFGYCEILPIA